MAEYIEREALINQIRLTVNRSSVGETSFNDISAKTICSLILEAPAADVVEVKHGEWKSCFEDWRKQIEGDECSACGFQHYGNCIGHYHYYPNCGAKMDLKEGAER